MEVQEKACGCIIIENKKVLLIKQKTGAWGFPKGHVEKGETEEQTAIREVKEETNVDVKLNPKKRYTMYYVTDKGLYKEIVLFMAEKIGGTLQIQESELDDAKWFNYEETLKTLSYNNTKDLFKQIMKDNRL